MIVNVWMFAIQQRLPKSPSSILAQSKIETHFAKNIKRRERKIIILCISYNSDIAVATDYTSAATIKMTYVL